MSKIDFFIGTCVLESESMCFTVAEKLKNDLAEFKDRINLHYKGSFDKANRTSIDSFRGPGLEEGLRLLKAVKEKYDLPVITDFHEPSQAMQLAEVGDVLQVPDFLCGQTDMIIAGAEACKKYNRKLKIKKGQFLAPWDVENIISKAINFISKDQIYLTERGSSFGYNNLIVDMASFQIMKSFGVKTVHDCTHCVQKPGGLGKSTGGKREQIEVLTLAATAAGADAFFMECHPDPSKALSDSATSLPIDSVKPLIKKILDIKSVL